MYQADRASALYRVRRDQITGAQVPRHLRPRGLAASSLSTSRRGGWGLPCGVARGSTARPSLCRREIDGTGAQDRAGGGPALHRTGGDVASSRSCGVRAWRPITSRYVPLERYGARVHTGEELTPPEAAAAEDTAGEDTAAEDTAAPALDSAGPGATAVEGRRSTPGSADLSGLVAAALDGDQAAWQQIVDRHAGLVWSVVRGYRLGQAEASDVAQTVWLRLVENLPRVHQPAALPGWLATTARRESIRALRRTHREIPSEHTLDMEGRAPDEDSPDWSLLATERQRLVWRAVSTLSDRCQQLLRALAYDTGNSYAEISAALEMPVGSIGPTRSRCLTQLRRALDEPGVGADSGER